MWACLEKIKLNVFFILQFYSKGLCTLPPKLSSIKKNKKIGSGSIFCVFASVVCILIGKDEEYEKTEKRMRKFQTQCAIALKVCPSSQPYNWVIKTSDWKWLAIQKVNQLLTLIQSENSWIFWIVHDSLIFLRFGYVKLYSLLSTHKTKD